MIRKGQIKGFGVEDSSSISGTFAFDYDKQFFGEKTLTGNTIFSDANLINDGTARGCLIKGDFEITLPSYWVGDLGYTSEDYDGEKWHRLTWEVINDSLGNEKVRYQLNKIEY